MFHFVPFCSGDSTSSFKFVSLLAKRPCLSDYMQNGFPPQNSDALSNAETIQTSVHDLENCRPVFTNSAYHSSRRNKPNKQTTLYRMRLLFWAGASLKCQLYRIAATLLRGWPPRKGDQSAALWDPYHLSPFSSDLWPSWQNEHDSDGHRNTYIRPTDCRHA